MLWSIGGVMRPTIKLKNQLEQVVMATPFARRLDEWISAAVQKDQSCLQKQRKEIRLTQCPGDGRPTNTEEEHKGYQKANTSPSGALVSRPVIGVFGCRSRNISVKSAEVKTTPK